MKFFIGLVTIFTLTAQTLPPSKSSVYKALPLAHKLWIDGDIRGAIAQFENRKATAQNRYNLALLHFRLNEDATALNYIKEAIAKDDEFADAYFLQGKIYKRRGFLDQAIRSTLQAIDEEDNGNYHLFLGQLYNEQGKSSKAVEQFESAVDEDPSLMVAHVEIALNIAKSNVADAIEYLHEALEDQYPSGKYYPVLGDLYMKQNKPAKAIRAYKGYLNIYPRGVYSNSVLEKLSELGENYSPTILDPIALTNNFKLKENEFLKYDVSYAINVGYLTIDAAGEKDSYEGREVLKVNYKLKSNTFLIDLDAYFEAYLNTKNLNTEISYFSRDMGEKINEQKIYIFDRTNRLFKCRTVRAGGKLDYVEKELPVNTQDGTALLYYTRGLVASKIDGRVTTIIDEKFKRTDIFNQPQLENEEVLNKSDSFHYIKAKAHYQGIAGMTGGAEGYFSKGDFVPVIGKMQIIVGKVRVELVEQR